MVFSRQGAVGDIDACRYVLLFLWLAVMWSENVRWPSKGRISEWLMLVFAGVLTGVEPREQVRLSK